MDFKEQIKGISKKVEKLKENVLTEEATKNAFIMPFIQALGYDVSNPLEVVPEFTADIGKDGEKVDYAILNKQKQPIILIECKKIGTELNRSNEGQLSRYFHALETKFAILTNGEEYRFYSDIEKSNKMDTKPFLVFNITKIKENHILELRKFCKDNFNPDEILSAAATLKYTIAVKEAIKMELNKPSDEFLKVFISHAYQGKQTKKIIEQFGDIVKSSFKQYVDEITTDRLQEAINQEATTTPTQIETNSEINEVITTEEEIEAFHIIRAILCKKIPTDKISYKDTISYFGVLYDNKVTKWICRLKLNENKKILILPTKDKAEIKFELKDISDLYKFSDKLLECVGFYCR